MKKVKILIGVCLLVLLLALAVGFVMAQGPEGTEEEVGATGEVGAAAAMADKIPIQGRLTDSSGNTLNGTYTLWMRLYDASSGGTPLCEDDDSVTVDNGLFNAWMDYCTSSDIDGRQLYLGLEVGSDGEMTPRRAIYAVPYAWSLKPGAIISDTRDVVLKVQSTGTGDSDAFIADASGDGEAIEAYAKDGVGIFAKSDTYLALQAYSYDHTDNPAIFGCSAASSGTCDPYRDDGPAGVMGYGAFGVYGIGTSHGVLGECGSSYGYGGYFHHTNGGVALVADSTAANNDDIVRFRNNYDIKFKVQGDGDVYIDGTYYDTGADFAEMLPAQDGLEPGDVLIIGADGQLTRSTAPYQTAVVGVYSTRPGFVGGVGAEDDLTGKVPLAVVGIVPVKASAENGAIRPGDLLVTAATPGYAMRAGENPPQGTVLGKALGELEEGIGVIEIIVTLQ
ncbi:MAG: hypothetical protein H5T62_04935 [Anaerolineae bacterium]|nr:hypothetical protein [Anaerolineae bacterium]